MYSSKCGAFVVVPMAIRTNARAPSGSHRGARRVKRRLSLSSCAIGAFLQVSYWSCLVSSNRLYGGRLLIESESELSPQRSQIWAHEWAVTLTRQRQKQKRAAKETRRAELGLYCRRRSSYCFCGISPMRKCRIVHSSACVGPREPLAARQQMVHSGIAGRVRGT